eukprot:COSAG01_NODE_8609_length_2720_cov_24.483022_2_plen_416_part_00
MGDMGSVRAQSVSTSVCTRAVQGSVWSSSAHPPAAAAARLHVRCNHSDGESEGTGVSTPASYMGGTPLAARRARGQAPSQQRNTEVATRPGSAGYPDAERQSIAVRLGGPVGLLALAHLRAHVRLGALVTLRTDRQARSNQITGHPNTGSRTPLPRSPRGGDKRERLRGQGRRRREAGVWSAPSPSTHLPVNFARHLRQLPAHSRKHTRQPHPTSAPGPTATGPKARRPPPDARGRARRVDRWGSAGRTMPSISLSWEPASFAIESFRAAGDTLRCGHHGMRAHTRAVGGWRGRWRQTAAGVLPIREWGGATAGTGPGLRNESVACHTSHSAPADTPLPPPPLTGAHSPPRGGGSGGRELGGVGHSRPGPMPCSSSTSFCVRLSVLLNSSCRPSKVPVPASSPSRLIVGSRRGRG